MERIRRTNDFVANYVAVSCGWDKSKAKSVVNSIIEVISFELIEKKQLKIDGLGRFWTADVKLGSYLKFKPMGKLKEKLKGLTN